METISGGPSLAWRLQGTVYGSTQISSEVKRKKAFGCVPDATAALPRHP